MNSSVNVSVVTVLIVLLLALGGTACRAKKRFAETLRNLAARLSAIVIFVSLLALGAQSQTPSLQSRSAIVLGFELQATPQSRGLQRASSTPVPTNAGVECQRRHADWERNRATYSFLLGAVFYFFLLVLLTFLRFSSTWWRVILSIVLTVPLGLALLALYLMDNFKVCPNPPGFIGSIQIPAGIWILAGMATVFVLIATMRYVTVVRGKFRKETLVS